MDRQKIFNLALKTFIFLSPVFLFKDFNPTLARGLFFILGTFFLFGISLGIEPRRKFSNIWLSLFLLLAFIRMFFNIANNPQVEWPNFLMAKAGFNYVFCGVLLFYIVYSYTEDIKEYFAPIIWVCAINFILTISQVLKHDFLWYQSPTINGFLEINSQLGQYSALSIPILYFFSPFLALIPLTTLILANSVSPIMATFAGIVFFGVLRGVRARIKAGLGIILILLGLLNLELISSKWACRPMMWEKTLRVSLQRPFLGWGYGSFQNEVTENKTKVKVGGAEYARAHNDYLHTAQELGWPIVIISGIFLTGLFKKFLGIKNKDKLLLCLMTSVFISLVNMFGQTEIRYASIAGTFIVMLALLSIKLEKEGN